MPAPTPAGVGAARRNGGGVSSVGPARRNSGDASSMGAEEVLDKADGGVRAWALWGGHGQGLGGGVCPFLSKLPTMIGQPKIIKRDNHLWE